MSRARGPHSPRQARLLVRSSTKTDPIARLALVEVLPDPAEVVVAERRPGHDQEPVLGQPGDGEVALDPAPPVEHLGVDDRADRPVDVVGAQPLEEAPSHPGR